MIEHGVSALVISPTYGDEGDRFGPLGRAGITVLQVLRRVGPTDRFPFWSPDYARGGRLAAEHLLSLGARRVAFAGGVEGRPITLERMSGHLEVMKERGRSPWSLPGEARAPSAAMPRSPSRKATRRPTR
jgi:LacI family transcriptional regulator